MSTHQHGFEDGQQSQYRHNQVAKPLLQIIEEFTKVSHSGCFVHKRNAFLLIFGLKHQTFCRFLLIFGHNYVTLYPNNLNQSTMSKDMNRIKVVWAETLETLYQIAECLNVDVKDLLNSSRNDDIQLVRFVKQ